MFVRWIDVVPMAHSLRVGACPAPQQQKCNPLQVTAMRTVTTMTSSFLGKYTALIDGCSLFWPTGCFSSWIILLSALSEWLWSRESGSTMNWLSPIKRVSRSYQLWLINHNSVSNLMTGKMILTIVGFQGCVYLTKDPLWGKKNNNKENCSLSYTSLWSTMELVYLLFQKCLLLYLDQVALEICMKYYLLFLLKS